MDYEDKHKEEIIRATQLWECGDITRENLEYIFPELAESMDERIRKALINLFKIENFNGYTTLNGIDVDDVITWLEKQGEQYNNEDLNILQRFSFYSYKDEPNILYLSGLYVNEKCRNKGIGTKILEVADEVAKSLNCHAIRLKTEIGSNAERLYRRNGYNTFKREGNNVWLEKQCEKKPTDDIQKLTDIKIHQGDKNNPYDMSFEEAQNYITKRDFDICCTDYAVYVDDRYIIQTIANLLRWADDNPKQFIEPKFKVGDWITDGQLTCKVLGVTCKSYILHLHNDDYCHFETDIQSANKYYHLWTIQDAKDGDVLAEDSCIFIIQKLGDNSTAAKTYCTLYNDGDFDDGSILYFDIDSTKPATKEQRDQLEKAMTDAGYKWDAEKKELKKIEDEEYNGEDYGIDSLFHAQRILEKTLGEVEGYQSDDGILEHKCAISAVKKLYARKPAKWSEEDEVKINRIVACLENLNVADNDILLKDVEWLKSLKQRMEEQQ